MPRTKRIEKEDILRAAVQLVRTQGEGALSVRGIAKELGSSTQPLYSEFGSMEDLRAALLDYLRCHYLHVECRNYKEFARHFLGFARREPELFRFLYLRRRADGGAPPDDPNYDETVRLLVRNLEMPPETAKAMHRQMQYRCYGLGVMLATGYCLLSADEIERELTEFYCIILRHYKGITDDAQLQTWLERSRNLIL